MKIFSFICYGLMFLAVFMYCYEFNESLKEKEVKESIISNNPVLEYDQDLENYVLGVLACEMPALYNDEALKAQAVAARTFAIITKDYKNSTEQCYITEEEMKEKWGSNFKKYYDKLSNDVMETKNMIIKKNNQLFKPFYFAISNGYTLSSLLTFNEEGIQGVSSTWDKDAKNYEVIKEISKSELTNLLGDYKNIEITKRDNTNHVLEICVDDKCFSGIEFRKLLNLRSTDFKIVKEDNIYKITTYGYGHGVGMSQNGANYLANNGYDYQYILNYYYQDIEFVSII